MGTTYQVDKSIDARGQMCPMPVLALAKAFRELASGQIAVISATDPGSKADIPAWAEKTGNTLLEMSEENGVFTYYLKKA
ncbi:MAG TPA: sulfurtransferase TusA family protein [Ktedonobacterales bacterium]